MTEGVVESQADEATQKKAADMGWVGPDKFKGAPEKFIDAEAFLERAETFVPFLKKERERLLGEVAAERQARAALESQVSDIKASLNDIEERYTVETQKRVESAVRDLKAQIKAAADDNDVKAVVALTSELEDLREAERTALADEEKEKTEAAKRKAADDAKRSAVDPVLAAEVKGWLEDHPLITKDKRKTALFNGFAEARRADGDNSVGKAFLDKVLEDMEEAFEKDAKPKVEGSRNGSGASGSGRGKSYSDMPAEARAACEADTGKFVGKGKKYADKATWQAAYAQLYFQE